MRPMKTIHGVIRGRTIELAEGVGLPDGQEVSVQVTPLPSWSEPGRAGFIRCAGILAGKWTDEDDRILDEIHQDRKRDNRRDGLQLGDWLVP